MAVEVNPKYVIPDEAGNIILSTGCSDSFMLIQGLYKGGKFPVSEGRTSFAVLANPSAEFNKDVLKQMKDQGWQEVCEFPSAHGLWGGNKKSDYACLLLAHHPTVLEPESIVLRGPERVVKARVKAKAKSLLGLKGRR